MESNRMNGTRARVVFFGAGLLSVATLGWILSVQAAGPKEQGFPTDWSHRHVVFSRPTNAAQAGRVEGDPRYWQQFARTHIARTISERSETSRNWGPFRGVVGSTPKLAAIHRDWSEDMGSGASVGADNYPAKFTFQTSTASCSTDFVVYNTGLTGSSSQANIIAYHNLYSGGCSGTVPQTYWAFNTGGVVLTAPVISFDGSQVAFVQSTGLVSGQGIVVLLKWKASSGTLTSPTTLVSVANSAYRTCVAPCMTQITLRTNLGTAVDDRTSSAFPDYNKDNLWIGGTSSWLHKITGAFKGTPAEAMTGGFPVQVNPGNPNTLSSPVYDFSSGNIFVGDYGGYVYRVSSTTGAVTSTAQLDHETGVVAAPIVDSTAGIVYVFASSDGTTACAGNPCSAVYLLSPTFSSGATGTKITVGASNLTTTVPLYEGDFDSTYQNSSNGTGNLYVCGNTGGVPTLYQITMNAGVASAAVTGPALSTVATGCSPVTDVSNPNAGGVENEWVFASAQASGVGTNCSSSGCIMNFGVSPRLASHAYSVGQEVLDTHFQIQVVSVAGTSGASTPTWSTTVGGTTTDGTVTWLDQGPYVANIASWQPNTIYPQNAEVLDSGGYVEINIKVGNTKSNPTPPTWVETPGVNNFETGGGPHWVNLGKAVTNSASASGGTSGISIDNVVGSGTLQGASQVYFSTLSNQTCSTSGGTGGCAVQASQSALQ